MQTLMQDNHLARHTRTHVWPNMLTYFFLAHVQSLDSDGENITVIAAKLSLLFEGQLLMPHYMKWNQIKEHEPCHAYDTTAGPPIAARAMKKILEFSGIIQIWSTDTF
ncbi:hypothetical protein ACJX0J_022628, partial [Zea mays]